jgi:hypothetical protein
VYVFSAGDPLKKLRILAARKGRPASRQIEKLNDPQVVKNRKSDAFCMRSSFSRVFDWRAQSAQVVKRRPVASARAESVMRRPQKIAVLVRVSNVAIGWTIYRGILAHSQEAFFAV